MLFQSFWYACACKCNNVTIMYGDHDDAMPKESRSGPCCENGANNFRGRFRAAGRIELLGYSKDSLQDGSKFTAAQRWKRDRE